MKAPFSRFSPIVEGPACSFGRFQRLRRSDPRHLTARPPEIVNGLLQWDLASRSVVKPML